ncbi:MAG: NifU-like protein [Firmicutes bacterium ADurb.Bin419]|jgi:nitrogen fixation NifU-like protein|nr:MAG: NifU-like protein [Firmicutes bacterium ADurb.Bin419]
MFCCNFSDKVLEHFMTPRNSGSMVDADSIGTAGDPACGDSLTLYIKVKENIIEDISFMVFGCVAAIATSSMTTELAKGKSLDEAYKINDQDIADALDGLPEQKMHCSVLGATALKNAIDNYYSKINGK